MIGLGRFGPSVAAELMRRGWDVLGVYGVTVVGIKRPGADFTHATAETVVHPGDVIIVTGKTRAVEMFAELDR